MFVPKRYQWDTTMEPSFLNVMNVKRRSMGLVFQIIMEFCFDSVQIAASLVVIIGINAASIKRTIDKSVEL